MMGAEDGKYPMNTYGEWRNSSTHSLSGHSMEVIGQLHAPTALPLGKEHPAEWSQIRRGRDRDEKNPFPLSAGNQTTVV
jgi:hypothetical protein